MTHAKTRRTRRWRSLTEEILFATFAASRENELTSREDAKNANALDVEEISAVVVDAAFQLHKDLGPGLLETVYEVVLARLLVQRGLSVERQKPVLIEYAGIQFEEGFRADLIVDGKLLVELKSVENLLPVHAKQVLTYLRLLRMPLALLINYGAATFKEGVKRIVNQHTSFVSSCLRVNQPPAEDFRL
jgi:iron complex transport system substrate-binding protein